MHFSTLFMRFNGAVTFSLRKSPAGKRLKNKYKSFNGAVTFSLRKYSIGTREMQKKRLGFNGAVTFSLRKYVTFLICRSSFYELQWGRNFFVTEILAAAEADRLAKELQWGRNFFVTEICMAFIGFVVFVIASMGP